MSVVDMDKVILVSISVGQPDTVQHFLPPVNNHNQSSAVCCDRNLPDIDQVIEILKIEQLPYYTVLYTDTDLRELHKRFYIYY